MSTQPANSQRALCILGVATFFVCLGWTIPYMVIVPFHRLSETWSMLSTGTPVLLGPDLTFLVPCAMGVLYVLGGKSVRAFWSRVPWFGPFILLAFAATLGSTLMAHLAYVITANDLGAPVLFLAVIAMFLAWRSAVSTLAWRWPLESVFARPE